MFLSRQRPGMDGRFVMRGREILSFTFRPADGIRIHVCRAHMRKAHSKCVERPTRNGRGTASVLGRTNNGGFTMFKIFAVGVAWALGFASAQAQTVHPQLSAAECAVLWQE
jgi:hypothetical protein